MKSRKFWFVLVAVFSSSGIVMAQSELEVDLGVFGGLEYNIFKSPDVLLNRDNNMVPFPVDSIIYTDYFVDPEVDIEFSRLGERSIFETGADLWYRKYIEFTDLDQSRLSAFINYGHQLAEHLMLGGVYDFRWSNRIGTSVTGDLLMRSFKYVGHAGQLYLDILPSEDLNMRIYGEYEYKDYYDERTRAPLDHSNLEVNFELENEINNDNDFDLEFSWTNRDYFQYRSLNGSGDYSDLHPFRNFMYFEGEFDYNWSPIRGLRINPGVEVTRRIDTYQDYYSYMAYGGSLRLRYFKDRFYISLYGDYKQLEYDIRPAFTSQADDPMLIYGYYDMELTLRYSISDQWDLFIILESDNRNSNTDLEYFKTRRPYKNYQVMLGLTYALPEMVW